jgi:hypothetical protein
MPSTNLQRTMGTATNAKKGTISFWIKLAKNNNSSEYARLLHIGGTSNDFSFYYLSDNLNWYVDGGATFSSNLDRELRDYNGYYHIVLNFDTTLATASDRSKLYINGELQSQTISGTITQNADIFDSSHVFSIGATDSSNLSQAFAGILAHYHFIDGTAYDASAFGQTNAASGIWTPKTSPSVTYGTNGFFLKFANSGSLGTDSSGNSNNFTVSGPGIQTLDTPSNVFATLNPLNQTTSNNFVLSNGNTTTLTSGDAAARYYGGSSTLGVSSGKWYCEFKPTSQGSQTLSGISYNPSEDARLNNYIGEGSYAYGYYGSNGTTWNNNSSSAYGNSYTDNDIIGIAMDLDNSKLYFSKNGTWQNSGDPTSGATGTGAISITSGETYFFSFGIFFFIR